MLNIVMASDLDHDNIVAEINHGGKFLCLLSKENADDDIMIEMPITLPSTGPDSLKRMRLADFIKIVDRAKEQLTAPCAEQPDASLSRTK